MSTTLSVFLLLGLGLILLPFIRLRELCQTIEALTERIAALERKLQRSETPPAPEKAAIPPSPLLARSVATELKPKASPPPLPVTPSPPQPAATPFNWEAFMGVKLFAW